MGSSGPSGSPGAGTFVGALIGNPDADDNGAFLAAILRENSWDAAGLPHFQPGAPACGDLMMGGSTGDWDADDRGRGGKKPARQWQSSQTWDTAKTPTSCETPWRGITCDSGREKRPIMSFKAPIPGPRRRAPCSTNTISTSTAQRTA